MIDYYLKFLSSIKLTCNLTYKYTTHEVFHLINLAKRNKIIDCWVETIFFHNFFVLRAKACVLKCYDFLNNTKYISLISTKRVKKDLEPNYLKIEFFSLHLVLLVFKGAVKQNACMSYISFSAIDFGQG